MKKQKKISLDQLVKTNVFHVPEEYFPSLPFAIEQKILATNPSLKAGIYQVPEEYFEKLPLQVLAKLPIEKLPGEISKQAPFVVPASYFGELTEKINASVLLEPKSLIENSSESIHAVPEGYFDSLPFRIQEKIREKKKKTIVPLYEQPAFRYAAAACFMAIILIASLLIFRNSVSNEKEIVTNHQPAESTVATTLIANLKKEEIKEYLEKQDNLEVAQLMEYSSPEKKEKIQKEFEKDLNIPLNEVDKKTLEMELNELDLSDLDSEI